MKMDLLDSWVTPDEAMNLQSKMLSLELILTMLRHSGAVFRNSPRFISCIRQHLCLSLLKNAVSPSPRVFNASLQVFVTLIVHFKHHLKHEISVFFNTVFLRILDSQNSTFQQKAMVLQLLHKICQDPQTIVDIYVNYDCDLAHTDIFGKVVQQLCRVCGGTGGQQHAAGGITPDQELVIRTKGAEAMAAMVQGLEEWTKRV
eukprot:CAMPEP_0174922934 /NCGR_PEP_ID=MMETSP1355-20121228/6235_1 /TAXON_ID=464990 /ORGANISM="Hemiselmis tepida, Strain CCMP443" /LENGTH=201 /DNA_ID=CAMNT_0016168579 /DNA_START=34 /DNA_END=636 /DNA_ORIENTATION=+